MDIASTIVKGSKCGLFYAQAVLENEFLNKNEAVLTVVAIIDLIVLPAPTSVEYDFNFNFVV